MRSESGFWVAASSAEVLQGDAQGPQQVRVVVDDQDGRHAVSGPDVRGSA